MAKPRLLDAYTKYSETITSVNDDFAEVDEWVDGNPDDEIRIGYFVSIDTSTPGKTITKSNSTLDVRGVTIVSPGFSANACSYMYDEEGKLLPKYAYVGFVGSVSVIDNGTCQVNDRCIPAEDGTAVPSDNEYGYLVLDRIDDTHVSILLEPQEDSIQRIKKELIQFKEDNQAYVEGTTLMMKSSKTIVSGKSLIMS